MSSYPSKIQLPLSIAATLFLLSCSSSMHTSSNETTSGEVQNAEERISININETLYFDFSKFEETWTGTFTLYQLNGEGVNEAKAHYRAANDSSWNDFESFVNFLNIYDLPPQQDIHGWVPDSGTLPRRVYNFEVFDGDTTRSFSYQDPELMIRNYWQAQSLLTFITYIQNDLKWIALEPKSDATLTEPEPN